MSLDNLHIDSSFFTIKIEFHTEYEYEFHTEITEITEISCSLSLACAIRMEALPAHHSPLTAPHSPLPTHRCHIKLRFKMACLLGID